MNDQDIRAKMLQDLYTRTKKGEETNANAQYYASQLGIDETTANFNLQYLVESRLADGDVIASIGTTKKMVLVWSLTHLGIQAVEGGYRRNFDINFNIINVNAPVTQSQIAAGKEISQSQSVSINSFEELYRYVDEKLDKSQSATLKPLLEELEADMRKDSIKVGTLRKIGNAVKTWGPVAIPIIDAITRLTCLRPA